MADTFTTELNLCQPEVGASTDTWGTKINADLALIDALFAAGPALLLVNGGTGSITAAGARTNLGLGTMATQSAAAVAIAGGTLAGITALSGAFDVDATGNAFITGVGTFGGQVWSQSTGFKFPDGSLQATASAPAGAANWQTETANFTTANSGAYYVTVNAVIATLHTGAVNDLVKFVSGLSGSNTFTINPAAGQTIMGGATLVVDRAFAPFNLVLIGTDWRIV